MLSKIVTHTNFKMESGNIFLCGPHFWGSMWGSTLIKVKGQNMMLDETVVKFNFSVSVKLSKNNLHSTLKNAKGPYLEINFSDFLVIFITFTLYC